LTPEQITVLQQAALSAPSSRGLAPWQFIFTNENKILKQLAQAKHGADFLVQAALGVVVAADPQISDVWIEDCALAAIYLQLAAQDLGLGSCWAQIRNRSHTPQLNAAAYVKQVLALPDNWEVLAVIGVGYAAEQKAPLKATNLHYDKCHWQKVGQKFP
jgi:nitroreductase